VKKIRLLKSDTLNRLRHNISHQRESLDVSDNSFIRYWIEQEGGLEGYIKSCKNAIAVSRIKIKILENRQKVRI